ncbi:ABC transporter substrate-binding protein [Candidatus Bathyarchaeota archaeon]|nr:ABC transporter substrate-binding protein [Candidatus Bathyarchaeota archaeon]
MTLACGSYDRTWALQSGQVQPEGVDLNYIALPPEELFWRMAVHGEFDASEFSLGAMSILLGQGDNRFVGIPVFPSRFFRHSSIFINTHSGIEKPEDLKGLKVGVPDYTMTANTWIRGLLEHDYGVKPTDMKWYTAGLNEPGRKQRVKTPPISGLSVTHSETAILSDMLDKGEIDVLIGAREPDCYRCGSPNVARLFPDYKPVERDYYKRTGIFPIMHLVVIKREIYEKQPWLAISIYKAFVESKRRCVEEITKQSALRYMLPWLINEMEETKRFMGDDYWKYGFKDNQMVLQTFIDYSVEQGTVAKRFDVEDLFAPETINVAKI